jgi:CheY-like chemotaxis protein
VLAAEDNTVNQLVLKTLLHQIGIDPVIVDNGAQAVAAWSREPWDVILMDIQMPEMDGPTAAGVIRTREKTEGRPRTPIIALTANAMAHQVAEYFAAGMDGFVAKPIEVSRLFEALQQVLNEGVDAESRPPDYSAGSTALAGARAR